MGNSQKVTGRTINGEASDWMLGNAEIIAFSAYLGTANPESNRTFIQDENVLLEVLQ